MPVLLLLIDKRGFSQVLIKTVQIDKAFERGYSVKKSIFFIVLLIVLAAFYKYGMKSVTVTAKNIQQSTDLISIDLKIPVVSGMINQKIQGKINGQFEKDALDFRKEIEKLSVQGKQDADNSGFPFRKFDSTTAFEVAYNKNSLLSIPVEYYQFTGGAHGSTEKKPYYYDLKTGRVIALGDIFKEGYNYKEANNQEVKRQIKEKNDLYFTQPGMEFQTIKENQPFYFVDGGLTIYFAQYEIAPYAAGIPEFKLPFTLFGNNVKIKG